MRLLAFLPGLVVAALATAAHAAAPPWEWAVPYLGRPLPGGSFLAEAEWVALRSEIEVEVRASGALRRVFRQVLAPTARSTGQLTIFTPYNENQRLVPPQLWVRSGRRTRSVSLAQSFADLPLPLAGTGRERLYLAATEKLAPADLAIVQWEVIDREPLLGEEVLEPFGFYPAAEWAARASGAAEGGDPPELRLVLPGAPASDPQGAEVVLRDLPALLDVYDEENPFLAAPLQALPYVLLRTGSAAGKDWPGLAAKARSFFTEVLAADPPGAWTPTAGRLTAGASPGLDTAARLASFVQSLTYRDIAWGLASHHPAPPSETLRSLSADCKGKVLLLQALLSTAGIESVPVLCATGGYQDAPVVPTLLAFDHVVLAIHLPESAAEPGALTGGPGEGWLLFDPTDSLATLGLPPSNLEGSSGLWLGPGGGLFPIHTRRPGCSSIEAALAVELSSSGEAQWTLTATGDSDFRASLTASSLLQEDAGQLRRHFQDLLRPTLPGLAVTAARFEPPDARALRPVRVTLGGSLPAALRPADGTHFMLPFPTTLLGQVLGLPAIIPARPPSQERAPVPWQAEPRYQGTSLCLRAELSLTLPAGWSVVARPELRPIAAPWLTAGMEGASAWRLDAHIARGSFARESTQQRLADLEALAALFRQPFLVQAPASL